ncbi:secreted RxLR effector protein 161-like [Miscanthus floridulus]|uniref:secreted RxLR effector protein 161-like n=1 Tax=Miscanthus floridulus TaxID=154761 RepID=UPI0034578C7D
MVNAKPIKTPMPTNGHLDLNVKGKTVNTKVYRSMIGSQLYLYASRPNIMLSVCMCARFQANPKEYHLVAIKRILRYLVHTPNLGLWYPKGSKFDLLGYSDSDYAGCKVDQKSTSGTCQFHGRSLVSWSSKKQNCVSLSIAEAEYIAAGACCAQLLWMSQILGFGEEEHGFTYIHDEARAEIRDIAYVWIDWRSIDGKVSGLQSYYYILNTLIRHTINPKEEAASDLNGYVRNVPARFAPGGNRFNVPWF